MTFREGMTSISLPRLTRQCRVERVCFEQICKEGTCQCQFCLINPFFVCLTCCAQVRLRCSNIYRWTTTEEKQIFLFFCESTQFCWLHLAHSLPICDENLPSFAVSTQVSSDIRSHSPSAERFFYIPPCHVEPQKTSLISVGHPWVR